MARHARISIKSDSEARCYHIICRVTQGQFWLKEERRKHVLRDQLWKVSYFCGVEVLSYCWMDNHIHLLVRVPGKKFVADKDIIQRCRVLYGKASLKAERIESVLNENGDEANALRSQLLRRMHDLSQFVKEWKQRFAIWNNRTTGSYGTLWSERFKSLWVEDDSRVIRTVAAYIHMNPVRAGMVEHPGDYRHSLLGACCQGNAKHSSEAKYAHAAMVQLTGDPVGGLRTREQFERYLAENTSTVTNNIWLKRNKAAKSHDHENRNSIHFMSSGHVIGTRAFLEHQIIHN